MQGILTVGEMIDQLTEFPSDTPVMVAVIKYPEEFAIRLKEGEVTWADHTDVECQPLSDEAGEITLVNGTLMIAVELTDYDEQRHYAGG